jgi:hypothetical protein
MLGIFRAPQIMTEHDQRKIGEVMWDSIADTVNSELLMHFDNKEFSNI